MTGGPVAVTKCCLGLGSDNLLENLVVNKRRLHIHTYILKLVVPGESLTTNGSRALVTISSDVGATPAPVDERPHLSSQCIYSQPLPEAYCRYIRPAALLNCCGKQILHKAFIGIKGGLGYY